MENAIEIERVDFATRLAALILDIILIFTITFIVAPIIGGFLGAAIATVGAEAVSAGTNTSLIAIIGGFLGSFMAILIVFPIIFIVYYLIEGLTGLTLGKLILGIKVANQDGTTAETVTLMKRWIIKSSGTMFTFLGTMLSISSLASVGNLLHVIIFIGCFMVLGVKRQAIHDMLAKTAVFKKTDII